MALPSSSQLHVLFDLHVYYVVGYIALKIYHDISKKFTKCYLCKKQNTEQSLN